MRIVQVVSSTARSGSEGHVRTLARVLRDRGHELTLVCPHNPWLGEGLEDVEVVQADFRAVLGREAHQALARVLAGQRADVLHAHLSRAGYVSLFAGWRNRIPVLLSVHTETREPLYRLAAHGRNRLIAVSGYIRDVLISQGVPSNRIRVVPHGTPIAEAPPSAVPDVLPPGKQILCLVGRICPEKGQLVAIQAMPEVTAHHPNAHLVCVGRDTGGFQALLEREAARLGVGGSLTFVPHWENVASLFDASEIALLPSVIESFGLVVLEAMARGRPVIVSPAGALPELVTHGESGLIVPNEPHQWALAICRLLGDPAWAECIGKRGREKALSEFSLDAMATGIEIAYSEAIEERR